MNIFDGNVTLGDVRSFADSEGKKTGLFAVVHVKASDSQSAELNPLFSGVSYFNLELSLHGPEVVDTLHIGDTLHLSIDTPDKEASQWPER